MSSTSVNTRNIADILPDFPVGPLTSYRQQASFDWRTMKLSIYDEECLRYIYDMWSFFENNELFCKTSSTLSFDEQRHLSVKRMKAIKIFGGALPMDRSSSTQSLCRKGHHNLLSALLLSRHIQTCLDQLGQIFQNPGIMSAWIEALFSFDVDTGLRITLAYMSFGTVLQSMGTKKHYKYVEQLENDEIIGCFALTEIAHGSNAKGIMTTATYDVKSKQFIMNSPSFEAAKCWIGCLGQTATHAIVYAKLITADGKNQGLHTFIVPIRCTKTILPFAGVIVGDMGEKIGLNGLDNGFVMFNSYRISKDCLLNKLGDVNDDGKYVSPIRDPNRRFGASVGLLSGGRMIVMGMAVNNLQKAIAIAVRYSAVRKQFSPDDSSEELAVIEYQQQQVTTDSQKNMTNEESVAKSLEIHAIASASKPITTWTVRDGIQECREACGGHGYLQAAGIGKIRNENDANCTYEGENTVLIQQTSNWLLSLMSQLEKGNKINTFYNSANFINDFDTILKSKRKVSSWQEAIDLKGLLNAYEWLVCSMLKLTYAKTKRLSKEGLDSFSVKNDSQTYHSVTLSTVFAEHTILKNFCNFLLEVQDRNCKEILKTLASLYGAWSLEKHLTNLYMGGYFIGEAGQLLRDGIINLCKTLKPEAVALVDTLAPPDFIINSVLGKSDGYVYQNMQSTIFSHPGAFTRPNWWQDIITWQLNKQSKL
ncbi:peroxisomal acyl-coenzyme A oxidase 3-like [Arctopsyche grandis]|uniref:peroxisomal acyl-coenzyme A oxidase 3-like n=1 Tax=Arctopsyche grandis TaxID=121162 RepID=UPI00406D7053